MGVCVYGAVRCFQRRLYTGGVGVLAVITVWFVGHAPLPYIMWVIATPNPRTPTNLAEYAMAPVYLASAGLVCYAVLRLVKSILRSQDEQTPAAEYPRVQSDDEESLIVSIGESEPFFARISFDKNKIFGVGLIALGVAAMSGWFLIPGVLFVMVGVSLIMDVRIWRR